MISIALCTYNGETFLSEQLQSILKQIVPVDEIIIVDDSSSDNTENIVEVFQQKYPGVIKFHQNIEQLGVVKNFERAISLCTGDWIFLSDQDDIWEKNKVEKMLNFAASKAGPLLIYTNAALIDEKGRSLNSRLFEKMGYIKQGLSKWNNNKYAFSQIGVGNNRVTGATVLINNELKNRSIPFLPLPEYILHDAYLALQAASENGLFFMNEPLIRYRIHPGQQVGIGNQLPSVLKAGIKNNTTSFIEFYKKLARGKSFRIKLLIHFMNLKIRLSDHYANVSEKNLFKRFYKRMK